LFVLNGHIDEIRPSTLEKYFFNPNLPGRELLMVMYCDGMAAVPEGGIKPEHLESLTRLMERIDELAGLGAGKKLPPPILNGGQIMKLLKLEPGPRVGASIAALREAQLDGKVRTRKQAERFIRSF
jgi:poly(A) polymerase